MSDEQQAVPVAQEARRGTFVTAQETLEWYAEQVRDCRKIGRLGEPAREALDHDGGKRARETLALMANTGAGK